MLFRSQDNMIEFAKKNHFGFPYLNDETQEIAKTYDAVCTPDFFGYNKNLELQYRGRLRELKNLIPVRSGESDLLKAMKQIAETNKVLEKGLTKLRKEILYGIFQKNSKFQLKT